jgi:glycosyltransferase involved in cell wall biosynthesis
MAARIEKLYIFNLATDLDNTLLAFTHDWIKASLIDANNVEVISTHVGRLDFPPQVHVREIGGGNIPRRIIGAIRLFRVLIQIARERRKAVVFYHMSNTFAALLGLPLRILGVRQGLWYSHSASPLSFKLAAKFSNVIFSSSPSALPVSNRKCRYVGHGINFTRFPSLSDNFTVSRKTFISLGRITPIKNLELFVKAVADSNSTSKEIHLAGPRGLDLKYEKNLMNLALKEGVTLVFLGEVPYPEIPSLLANYSICYTGNPKTTDKAAIEAAAVGCFVICSEPNTQELTGMDILWDTLKVEPSSLKEQINSIIALSETSEYRRSIAERATTQNNVHQTVRRILADLIDV